MQGGSRRFREWILLVEEGVAGGFEGDFGVVRPGEVCRYVALRAARVVQTIFGIGY